MMMNAFHAFCRNHQRIYCYGAGRYGRTTLVHLQENGLDIEAFLITGVPDGSFVLGKPVKSIDDVVLSKQDGVILAIGGRFREAMIAELAARKIQEYFVVDEHLLPVIEAATEFEAKYSSNRFINVLMYHRIADDMTNLHGITVSPRNFAAHMAFLSKNYRVLRFEEDWSSVKESAVVVTFDDGYSDNYRYALPILERYGIPATIFVSTGNIDTDRLFWWDTLEGVFALSHTLVSLGNQEFPVDSMDQAHRFLHDLLPEERCEVLSDAAAKVGKMPEYIANRRSLTSIELKKLAASSLVTIGAHTVTHSSLNHEPKEQKRWEILSSREYLQKNIGAEINTFSYPFGDYDEDTLSILASSGFKKACTVTGGLADSEGLFQIPRNKVLDVGVKEFEKFLKRCKCVYA